MHEYRFLNPDELSRQHRGKAGRMREPRLCKYLVEIHDHTSFEIVISGSWAYERFSTSWTEVDRISGERTSDTVHGIHIYRRQADSTWKIARDVWNSTSQ